jgi:hypothetical protein
VSIFSSYLKERCQRRVVKGELFKSVPHCGGNFHPQKVGGFHPLVCVLPLFFKIFALDESIN